MTAQEKKQQLLSLPSLKIHRQPKPLPLVALPKKLKTDPESPPAPPPSKAQSDYVQNGLQLPQTAPNLRRLLADVERTGYFDLGLNYRLRRKEVIDQIKDRIRSRLAAAEQRPSDPEEMDAIQYEPLIEKSGGSFERYFRMVLEEP